MSSAFYINRKVSESPEMQPLPEGNVRGHLRRTLTGLHALWRKQRLLIHQAGHHDRFAFVLRHFQVTHQRGGIGYTTDESILVYSKRDA